MKFWIKKQNPLKIWKHNFPIHNDIYLSLSYYAPSDGKNIRIEDEKNILSEFDLNGRIKVSERTFGKFENELKLSKNIYQRIIIENNQVDLINKFAPAHQLHLSTDKKNWKEAIENAVKYEIIIDKNIIANIIHNKGLKLREKNLLEADVFDDKWFQIVLIHCVNLIENSKEISSGE